VTGWGKLDKGRRLMSNSLRQVEVPILSNYRCENYFRSDLAVRLNSN